MLKLQGHPPMLMRRDGKEVNLSSRLASIVDRCVDPNPNSRMSVNNLLSQSFFKVLQSILFCGHIIKLLLSHARPIMFL